MAQRPLLPWNWRRENSSHLLANGWAEVKATGQVIVHDPPPGGRPARLRVDPGSRNRLRLLVNGIEQQGEVLVRSHDTVMVRCEAAPAEASFHVIVRQDGLVATVTVHYAAGRRVVLEPTQPASLTVLSAVMEMENPLPIKAADVLAEMSHLGIGTGLIEEADLQEFLDPLESVQIVAAQGVPAQVPTGEKFVPSHALLDLPWQERPRGVIVAAGTLLGTMIPASPAAPGEDVYGRPIPPAEYSGDPHLPLHGPIRVEGDPPHLFAEAAGRVLWSPDYVRVIPVTVLNGKSLADHTRAGVLYAPGDVIIQDDVKRQSIAAEGWITIKGSVSHSTMAAGVGVTVAGTTRESQIVAVFGREATDALRDRMVQWRDFLQDLLSVMADAQKNAPQTADLPPGRLIQKLIPLRYPEWDEMCAWVREAEAAPYYRIVPGSELVLSALAAFTRSEALEAMDSMEPIERLLDLLTAPFPLGTELVWENPEESPGIHLGQVHAATVRCGADLTLRDAWKATLEVTGSVTVTGGLAGGVLTAGKAVDAEEIGNRAHLETSVKVLDASGQVSARRLFANAIVQVARVRRRLSQDVQELIIDGIETPI